MKSAIIKKSNIINFPVKIHIYIDGVLQGGRYFENTEKIRAYLIAENFDKFVSTL